MIRRSVLFAGRNSREILRDPVNLFFALGFPVIFLLLLSLINAGAPASAYNPAFRLEVLAPGIAAFAPVFMALFPGMLLAKDRTSSFLTRLLASPVTPAEFLLGYTLPMVLTAMAQSLVTFLTAGLFGLAFTADLLLAVLLIVPVTLLYDAIGLLCGSVMSDKAVGGVCGALLTIAAGWCGGIWFPPELIGGAFQTVTELLPFSHGVQAASAAASGRYGEILPHITVVLAYDLALFALAIWAFHRNTRGTD